MTTTEILTLAGIGGAVFLGASTQRISGVGFALVASPLMVALLGPFDGILVINLLAVLTALAVFAQTYRAVQFRRALLIAIPAVIAVVPGSWVAIHLQSELLSVAVGVMVIFALVAGIFVKRVRFLNGRSGAIVAGAVSGFMNVTAGVGGPAVTAFAVATRWPQASFAASVQPYFAFLGLSSLVAKHSLPNLHPLQWAVCAAALVGGVAVGNVVGPRIPARVSRSVVTAVAFAGALLIVIKPLFLH